MKRTSVAHLNSASAKAIDVVGEFWNLLIIRAIFMGVTRFEALQSDLGIARNILTDRLSSLIETDVLKKIVYNQKPERFEYHLTEKGKDLFTMMSMIKNWGDKWLMDGGQAVSLVHNTCAEDFVPAMVCQHCNELVTGVNDLSLARGPRWGGQTGWDSSHKKLMDPTNAPT
ncbi:MAG: transcriptional regulator [Ilumatobacteraceae bacterium]|nr:transcriptional regulator [Ilumatobacteraceae bacterium]